MESVAIRVRVAVVCAVPDGVNQASRKAGGTTFALKRHSTVDFVAEVLKRPSGATRRDMLCLVRLVKAISGKSGVSRAAAQISTVVLCGHRRAISRSSDDYLSTRDIQRRAVVYGRLLEAKYGFYGHLARRVPSVVISCLRFPLLVVPTFGSL